MPSIRTTSPAISSNEISKVTIQDADAHAWNILSTGEGDVNVKRVGGVAIDLGAGAVGAGTIRVTRATDDSKVAIIQDAAAHAWNILTTGEGDVNLNKIAGNDVNVGAGAASTGTLRVIHATDDLMTTGMGIVDNPAPDRRFVIGGVAETTFPAAVADGDVVNHLLDEYGRQWLKGYDPGSGSLLITDIAPIQSAVVEITFTQLTAAGSTVAVNIQERNCFLFQIVVAAIDTSVTVRVEGSNDNTSWANLDDGGVDTTYTANGTYQLSKDGVKVKYVRFTFVSELGGTAVTLDVKLIAGR